MIGVPDVEFGDEPLLFNLPRHERNQQAHTAWRESLIFHLGIGLRALTAKHPYETRLACHGCPNLLVDEESLPKHERQLKNLTEVRGLTSDELPAEWKREAERELVRAFDGLGISWSQEWSEVETAS